MFMTKQKQFNFTIDEETKMMIDGLKERGCNLSKILRNAIKNEYKILVEPFVNKDQNSQ